jgi:membrane protein
VYYSAVILLLGAELTEAVAAERGVPIRPNAHAMWQRDALCGDDTDRAPP